MSLECNHTSSVFISNTKPHMHYWVKDDNDRTWRILLMGEYEKYEDGTAIVADLYAAEYESKKKIYQEEQVPVEIRAFAESLLDDGDTYIDILKEYEEAGQHLL